MYVCMQYEKYPIYILGVQCDDFMLDSGNSSCDPEIVSGDDVICNFTCNDDYNLTDIDTRMCQDGNLTVNATLCMRSRFVSIEA